MNNKYNTRKFKISNYYYKEKVKLIFSTVSVLNWIITNYRQQFQFNDQSSNRIRIEENKRNHSVENAGPIFLN